MFIQSTSKLAKVTILTSCIFSVTACAQLQMMAKNDPLAVLTPEEEKRLTGEWQAQAEAKLQQVIGTETNLQFKSEIARLYAENDYTFLWSDKNAEKQFLHDYAAMVASGISSKSAKNLEQISLFNHKEPQSLAYDILLSDAFLDYMYYAKNVSENAQNWLYGGSYKAQQPSKEQIAEWISAVKNKTDLQFVQNLSNGNKLYRQTVQRLMTENNTNELARLAINAQRLRVIPSFENGIFVNIPTYQLNYVRDGQLVLNSRVIVGKNERRTPVMYSKLSNVVVNPPWNAPVRLINEDLLPKIRKDPSYLQRYGYEILNSKGQVISPSSINWSSIGAKFPYHLRQKPSDNTALGRYKFNMPSSDAIYLHDTPSRKLFSKNKRALSSGCVRVEKADQLATILLKEAGWSDNKKQTVLDSRKTTWATIKSDNPVYLYYVTAWVDDGQVKTAPDIYGYDKVAVPKDINWDIIKKYLM
ncbi:L,D-transpeptidase-like protein [Cricetibacter osteomyelitidis]|uniref:L,D-transpeptidase-like protein n=1 Tax=Cricetibacter osteomyelitidis TaxID=1521931 RepID=A0A4R2T8M6_9PAST|nr:L,D-transpeptidase family protein [Cricetibacter osteomyelitidis]TCP93538.1 L,D-transpeptidase-like protein [Cricetibacter osteomyelitidis]